MSDFCQSHLPPNSRAGSEPGLHQQVISLPGAVSSSANVGEPLTMGPSQSPVGYTGYPEQAFEHQPPKNPRNRRKSAPGSDHVKHRRTRSGCFTCRSRRVKCDEARPICDRCRKGKRDCVYPDLSASAKSASAQDSKTAGTGEEEEDTDDSGLTPIPDEEYELSGNTNYHQPSIQTKRGLRRANTASSLSLKRVVTRNRQSSETPSLDELQSPSTIVSNSASFTSTPTSASVPEFLQTTEPDWSHLPSDLRHALDYFKQNITHCNYGVHKDFHGFFQTTFLHLALRHEALLNAIVSFSLYLRSLNRSDGKIEDFLRHYTHAVTLLLGNLQRPESKADLATLLTILQLATIEEYLGDWVNLMGHQKAALEILMAIFTGESITKTPIGRILLLWYLRLGLLVAWTAGTEVSPPQNWLDSFVLQCQSQLLVDPQNLEWTCEKAEIELRLISIDLCRIDSRRKAGELEGELLSIEHEKLSFKLQRWREDVEQILGDPSRLLNLTKQEIHTQLFHFFPHGVPFLESPLASMIVLLADWHTICMLHMAKTPRNIAAKASAILGNVTQHAEALCQIIEASLQTTILPRGLLLLLHPVLAVAAMYLLKSPPRLLWLKERFAWHEACGCIYSAPLRAHLARTFEDPTIMHWWLPHDQGLTPVLRNLRAFADERNQSHKAGQSGQLQTMEEIFEAVVDLRLEEVSTAAEYAAE